MGLDFFDFCREQVTSITIKNKIKTMSDDKRDELNKVINFAVSYWFSEIFHEYKIIRNKAIQENKTFDEDINQFVLQLSHFRKELGIKILLNLLSSDEEVVVDQTYGILVEVSKKNKIDSKYFPKPRLNMRINQQQVLIKDGYEITPNHLVAYDVKNKFKQPSDFLSEVIENNFDDKKTISADGEILLMINMIFETLDAGFYVFPYYFDEKSVSTIDFVSIVESYFMEKKHRTRILSKF